MTTLLQDSSCQDKYLAISRVQENNNLCVPKAINSLFDGNRQVLDYSLTHILSHSPGLVSWKNINSEYLGCNEEMVALSGLDSAKEIIGKRDEDVPWCFYNSNVETIRSEDNWALSGGTSFVVHKFFISGKKVISFLKKIPLIDKKNNIVGIVNYAKEIINPTVINIVHNLIQENIEVDKELIDNIRDLFVDENNNLHLAPREEECLYYLLRGMSSKEIGKMLNLSYRTIEFYLEKLKTKFSCRKTSQLIIKASELGYLNNTPSEIILKKVIRSQPAKP